MDCDRRIRLFSETDISVVEPRKRPTSGEEAGKIFQIRNVLELPSAILGLVIRCFKWYDSEMRSLSLTCKRLKMIVDSHPQRAIQKVIAVISMSPLNYCPQGPHPRLLQYAFSQLSYLQLMNPDFFTATSCRGLNDVNKLESFPAFLQISWPDPLIPFIASFAKYYCYFLVENHQGMPIDFVASPAGTFTKGILTAVDDAPLTGFLNFSDEFLGRLPPVIQQAYLWNQSQIFKIHDLMIQPYWTQEDIDGIDWSFILRHLQWFGDPTLDHSSDNGTILMANGEVDPTPEASLFDQWLQSVGEIHGQKPLPRDCLLALLACSLYDNASRLFEKLMSDKGDDPNFMKLAVRYCYSVFDKCSLRLKQDRTFVLDILTMDGHSRGVTSACFLMKAFPPQLRNDKEILFAWAENALPRKCKAKAFACIGEELQKELPTNKEFLLEFLSHFHSFEFPSSFSLSAALADDEDFMKEAIKHSCNILTFASTRVIEIVEIYNVLMQYQVHTFDDLSFIPQPHRRSAVDDYIEKTGDLSPFHVKIVNRDQNLKAIGENYKAFLYVHDSWLEDETFVSTAAELNPLIILNYGDNNLENKPLHKSILERLIQNRTFFLRALHQLPRMKRPQHANVNQCLLDRLPIPDHYKMDGEIVLTAALKNPLEAHFIDPALFAQEDFVEELWKITFLLEPEEKNLQQTAPKKDMLPAMR